MVNTQYTLPIAGLESSDGCPVTPGFSFTKVYYLVPLASSNKEKHGIALDGYIKVKLRYQVRPLFL
jgi:arrestin-2